MAEPFILKELDPCRLMVMKQQTGLNTESSIFPMTENAGRGAVTRTILKGGDTPQVNFST